jgi:hypothetical protein
MSEKFIPQDSEDDLSDRPKDFVLIFSPPNEHAMRLALVMAQGLASLSEKKTPDTIDGFQEK